LVGVLVLFANSPYTYFASVFIVATAVTQLEFLQNLAAIIRGSKEYFEYQKETQSRGEVKDKIEKELFEEEVAAAKETKESTSFRRTSASTTQSSLTLNLSAKQMDTRAFAMVAYEFALNKLEEQLGKPIDRYPRFVSKNGRFKEFDGVLETESEIIVFEIKVSFRQVIPARHLKEQLSRVIRGASELAILKNKSAEVRLVYVVFGEHIERGKVQMSRLQEELQAEFGRNHFSAELLTYADIGLGAFADEMKAEREANKPMQLTADASAD
tara:strand:+ start:835 stop:1644 length:810 start_codon:yes stop_codon:yes gene_type:complete